MRWAGRSMTLIEGCFRVMKTTGLQTRIELHYWEMRRIIVAWKLKAQALLLNERRDPVSADVAG